MKTLTLFEKCLIGVAAYLATAGVVAVMIGMYLRCRDGAR